MRLLRHIVPTIRSLPHAMLRSNFMWALAQPERRGVPLDLSRFGPAQTQWNAIQTELAVEKDREYGCYVIEAGRPHWRKQNFANYVKRNGMTWPTHPRRRPRRARANLQGHGRPLPADRDAARAALIRCRNCG